LCQYNYTPLAFGAQVTAETEAQTINSEIIAMDELNADSAGFPRQRIIHSLHRGLSMLKENAADPYKYNHADGRPKIEKIMAEFLPRNGLGSTGVPDQEACHEFDLLSASDKRALIEEAFGINNP
jgi:hypothetical protein